MLWDANNRLVLCNSNFLALHNLPDEAVKAGTPYDVVVAAGRQPVVRTKVISEGQVPGARTFEAQLEDGRWLHISERRTKDGGYVSVGTDITTIKRHEEKLMNSEQRLMKTVVGPARLATHARASGRRACRPRREIFRRKDPRRGSQPGEIELPRQYEPRAAHAAQRHHRLLRDHEVGDVRPDRRRQISRLLQGHPPERPIPARRHQRHSRHVQDRGRPHPPRFRAGPRSAASSHDTMRVVSARADDKQIELAADIARGIRVRADQRLLKQIVLNLLSNAVKFTPEGGRITVRARVLAELGAHRHRRYRHRNSARTRSPSSGGRSSRSKASSPRAIRVPGSASPSRAR